MCLILISLYLCQPASRLADGRLKVVQKRLLFRKECCQPCDFCGAADHDGRAITHV